MNQGRKEIINVRLVSTLFIVIALAIFKPFGLEAWQWNALAHLLALFALGIISCLLTEGILKYIIGKPRSTTRGVSYIISRNLWFQCINTPLVALLICLYRHFAMSNGLAANRLSWGNYLETLIIIGFLSFAIGLYWRFKYRSRFLSKELQETQLLNEQLKAMQLKAQQHSQTADTASQSATSDSAQPQADEPTAVITLSGTTSESVTLRVADLLYAETVGNYVKVYHLLNGKVQCDMLRATSKQIEDDLSDYPMIVRCHRAFLANLHQVEQIVAKAGTMSLVVKHSHETIPVSRSNMVQIRESIKRL